MDILIFIVFAVLVLALVGGALSAQHAIIKPVVDWMYPPGPDAPEPIQPETEREAWLEMVRERKRQRLEMEREIARDLRKG